MNKTVTIEDQEGTKFSFTKHEFDPELGVYVNHINYSPNTKTTIRSSINVLLSQARFSGLITKEHTVPLSEEGLKSIPKRLYDNYKFSFFNSRFYHAEISLFYKRQYLLVIKDGIEFDRQKLLKLGVTAVTESEFINAKKEIQENKVSTALIREKINIQPLSDRAYKVKGRSVVEVKEGGINGKT